LSCTTTSTCTARGTGHPRSSHSPSAVISACDGSSGHRRSRLRASAPTVASRTPPTDERRACRLTIRSRSLPSAIAPADAVVPSQPLVVEAVAQTTHSSGASKSRGTPPCEPAVGGRSGGTAALKDTLESNFSPTDAHHARIGGFTRQPQTRAGVRTALSTAIAVDEEGASLDGQSAHAPLLHPCQGGCDAGAIEFHVRGGSAQAWPALTRKRSLMAEAVRERSLVQTQAWLRSEGA
jgi:hypothetical protein